MIRGARQIKWTMKAFSKVDSFLCKDVEVRILFSEVRCFVLALSRQKKVPIKDGCGTATGAVILIE